MTAVRRWARRCRSASSAAAEESSSDSSSVWFLSNRATLLCSDPEVEDALPDIDEIPKVITVSLLNHISNASRAGRWIHTFNHVVPLLKADNLAACIQLDLGIISMPITFEMGTLLFNSIKFRLRTCLTANSSTDGRWRRCSRGRR